MKCCNMCHIEVVTGNNTLCYECSKNWTLALDKVMVDLKELDE